MKDSDGPRPSCLAGGPPQRSRTIFGVPDAKEDDPPVPQELQPLRDDLGVEHIVTADEICPQGRFIAAG